MKFITYFIVFIKCINIFTLGNLQNVLIPFTPNKFPVVLMHGIFSNVEKMNELKQYITNFNIIVIVPEIGNGSPNSLNIPLYEQGKMLCEELQTFTILKDGFNFIGISQGGILGRYYIEMCDGYKVNNFITMVTPHGGVYNKIGSLLKMYEKYAQSYYSFSAYWRDPYNYDEYKTITLLARLNNEIENNGNFVNKEKFNSINNFIMVYSYNDIVVSPPESGKFSTYSINTMDVIPIEETIMYINLGLDKMIQDNKIHIYKTNCTHEEHVMYKCFISLHEMFDKYINL